MAANSEIHSFVSKFLGLMSSGYDATLKFDSKLGECSVQLQCNLGRPLPPVPPKTYCNEKYRNQSYYNRQKRRREEKFSVSTQAEEASFIEEDSAYEASFSSKNENKAEEAITKSNSCATSKSMSTVNKAEKAVKTCENEVKNEFPCAKCDFVSSWATGLEIHESRAHDECVDVGSRDIYEYTKHYWKKGWLGQTYQCFLDATAVIEESKLSEEQKSIEKDKILEARKKALGASYKDDPP